ncbi:MAG: hypothetical protein LBQ80_00750 [Clostridium sp.]|jgi:hypothetical protein|nr:hypothetical protein [Clostridium sp.]
MKINNLSRLEKLYWISFAVMLPLSLALRLHQVNSLLEPGTGFYAQRDWTIPALNVLMGLFVLLLVAVSYFSRLKPTPNGLSYIRKPLKSRLVAGASFVFALFLCIDCLICLSFVMNNPAEELLSFTYLMKSGLLPRLLESVMAVPAAAFVVLFGLAHIKGTDCGRQRFLALFPALWLIMRTVFRFTRTYSFVRVSELYFELLALVFLLVFFMAFAQCSSGVNDESQNYWLLPASGFPAAVALVLCFVPRIAAIFMGNAARLTELAPPEPTDLAVALFVVALLKTRLGKGLSQKELAEAKAAK